MPLRDLFHPAGNLLCPWSSFYSAWIHTIVRHLNLNRLSPMFRAEPVALVATAGSVKEDTFEVRILDEERDSRCVAVVDLVGPGNKDQPSNRQAFARKCVEYLRQGVSIVVVDVVTGSRYNLHDELLSLLELAEPRFGGEYAGACAVAYRPVESDDRGRLEMWEETFALGSPMPSLPLWLKPELAVPVELEATFQETWNVLRLG